MPSLFITTAANPPVDITPAIIIAALASDRFEHYIPDLKWVTDAKQADVDAFLEGSAKMGSEK